jgi:adenylate cyclase
VIGTVTSRPDKDGIFRRTKLFTLFDGKAAPGLSMASRLAAGESEVISYDRKDRALQSNEYTIPVDKHGASLLRFRKSIDAYIPYSASEVLQSAENWAKGEEPLLYPEDFANKYVFVGYYAPGVFDLCSSPVSPVYPGVGIHITMLDNILKQDFIRTLPGWLYWGVILLAAALTGFFTFFSNKIPLAVGGSAAALIVLCIGAAGGYYAGFWIPVVAPMTGILLAFLTATLYNYATEGSQRRFIKLAFSQYLSPTVIEQLLANPELLSLGGERREISIFFSDVQGFTSISEKLDPAKLTVFLNDYLSFMTDTILDSGGTIDKYEGDAIIAFWNAPLSYRDHAARSLRASMACQQKLAERQDSFEEKFGFRLLTRIGLNTGYAVVGNMGSSKRFDYTMLGDSVNLAARLEGLNKQFGTYLMCTENTFNQALGAGAFFGRKLAQVAVVGKKEPVTVYEPMPEEVYKEKEALLRQFGAARDMFYQGDFAGALKRFDTLAGMDKPSFYYAEQCRYYLENPGQWKGFWQALSK